MTPAAPPTPENRPRQATWAGWMVVLGAAFSVVTGFQVVGGARSLETREAITGILADPPVSELGLDVERATVLLQSVATAAAVIAAMMTVLGVHALRGDRRSRLALTILAVPLFVTGLALGGFLTSVAAAATGLLWISPAREWYAGLPIPEPPGGPRSGGGDGGQDRDRTDGHHRAVASDTTTDGHRGDHADHGHQADRARPSAYDPAGWLTPTVTRSGAGEQRRPDTVTTAVAVTLATSGLVLMLTVLAVAAFAVSPDAMLDELMRSDPALAESGIDRGTIMTTIWVTGAAVSLASTLAVGLALLTLTRRRWAAVSLMVLAGATVFVSLLATVSSPAALLPGIAAVVALIGLWRGWAWFG